MATINAKVVQQMLDQIDALKKTIETAGDEGRNKLKGIKTEEVRKEIPQTADGNFDTAAWAELDEDRQKELYQRLALVRDSLHVAAGFDGPPNPKHIMYAEYASNTAIIAWASVGLLLTVLLLRMIVLRWGQATGTDFATKIQAATAAPHELEAANDKAAKANAAKTEAERELAGAQDEKTTQEVQQNLKSLAQEATIQLTEVEKAAQQANVAAVEAIQAIRKGGATESSVLMMVILLGALGGSLHLLRSLVMFVGNRQLKRSWLLYYLSTPITGAGLASIVYMMLRVGLLGPSGGSANGSAITNLNLIAIYAFAALTGLFASTALDKLSEIFKTMFRTGEPASKDALGSEKPSEHASAAATTLS